MARFVTTATFVIAAFASLACAPTPPPLPTATPAPTPATSAAAATPVRVTTDGTVKTIATDKLTLNEGQSFPLTDRTNVIRLVPLKMSDLKPGQYVAITAKRQNDNSLLASIINVFPTVGNTFQAPMPGGNLMTNATIDQISGDSFTVSFTGGGAKVVPGPDVKINQFQQVARTDVKEGASVTVITTNGTATAIQLH
jgi:hypothetical protein